MIPAENTYLDRARFREKGLQDQSRVGDLNGQIEPPDRNLRICVVIPARNERAELAALLRGLAKQIRRDGSAFPSSAYEVILLANNCDDGTAEIARTLSVQWPKLRLHVAEVNFDADCAHVGSARRLLMDAAVARLSAIGRNDSGIIATSDADSVVGPRWLAQTCRAFAVPEVHAVGGYIFLCRESFYNLPKLVQARSRHDLLYKMLIERLNAWVDPNPFDTWPRHFFHNGASLAVRVPAYLRAGGLPIMRAHEDMEFHRRLEAEDLQLRHDLSVRVATSARRKGRVPEGMSMTLQKWEADIGSGRVAHFVEAPASLRRRAELRHRLRVLWQRERGGSDPDGSLKILADELSCDFADLHAAWHARATFGGKWQRVFEFSTVGQKVSKVPVEEAISDLRKMLNKAEGEQISRKRAFTFG